LFSEEIIEFKARDTFLYYLMVLVGGLVLYVFTCAPAIMWHDSGLFAYRIWHNDIEGVIGLALAHPLYILIGIVVKYIPIGDLAYRINLISAVFGAVTVANVFLLVRLWCGRNLAAVVASATLAFSWTFWQHAVMAEVYTLYTAGFSCGLILLLLYLRSKRIAYLYLLGLCNGLAIANHLWGLLSLACYGILVMVFLKRKEIRLKHVLCIILFWFLGVSLYGYLVVKNMIVSGDVMGTLSSALFGKIWQGSVLNTSISLKIVAENIAFILLNYPTPNLILLFLGLWLVRRWSSSRSFANILIAMLGLYFVFAFRYSVADRYVFFLPCYVLGAILVGVGADIVVRRYNCRILACAIVILALLPVPVYALAPSLARKTYKALGQRRQRPYRDEYVYFLQPWKRGYRGAQRFADEALEIVEDDAIIYADSTIVHTLLYVHQAQAKRPDVKVVSKYYWDEGAPEFNERTIEQLMQERSLYVVSPIRGYCPEFILDDYDTVKKGVLYKVVERKSNG
jgi:hypothetical protein